MCLATYQTCSLLLETFFRFAVKQEFVVLLDKHVHCGTWWHIRLQHGFALSLRCVLLILAQNIPLK